MPRRPLPTNSCVQQGVPAAALASAQKGVPPGVSRPARSKRARPQWQPLVAPACRVRPAMPRALIRRPPVGPQHCWQRRCSAGRASQLSYGLHWACDAGTQRRTTCNSSVHAAQLVRLRGCTHACRHAFSLAMPLVQIDLSCPCLWCWCPVSTLSRRLSQVPRSSAASTRHYHTTLLRSQ